MNPFERGRIGLLFLCALALLPPSSAAQPSPAVAKPAAVADGPRDFDWEIGTWRTHVKLRQEALTGSDSWVEYKGTSVVSALMNGRANMVELDVAGPAGSIVGLSLRLYNPQTRQWSLNYANARVGTLTAPVYGGFKDGRGEFYGQEMIGGRPILVRFVISDVSPTSARFEQAFSEDGGESWEANWIAVDTRIGDER